MTYIAVKDLKQSTRVWERLREEREIVITRDGRPCAILVGVSPDAVDETLAGIRRSLFSVAVSRARRRGARKPPPAGLVEREIRAARRARKSS